MPRITLKDLNNFVEIVNKELHGRECKGNDDVGFLQICTDDQGSCVMRIENSAGASSYVCSRGTTRDTYNFLTGVYAGILLQKKPKWHQEQFVRKIKNND